MKLRDRCRAIATIADGIKAQGMFPYFRPVGKSWGTEVEVAGKRLVMIGSNDYLGLSHDPRVKDASAQAVYRWGTGPGGSRFLSGNMELHQALEERLAAFVGKKKAVVHVTGFSANLGALKCLIGGDDLVVYDKESHASIIEGVLASKAKMVSFSHNDATHASKRVENHGKKTDGDIFLITEGVFSMSGDICNLAELVKIKEQQPDLIFYLDDAHGLGVLGDRGQGTAVHFGVVDKVDFIMGTFSKAMASIGGFIASDDIEVLEYIRHQSRTQIFSAALPAGNTAAVLACLDVLEVEPDRVARLHAVTDKMRRGYKDIGLRITESNSPIIPITIGPDDVAFAFSQALFDEGIFALPAIYPAVPRGEALIRTAYMSTHTDRQLDYVLDVLDKLSRKFRVRIGDGVYEAEAAKSDSENGKGRQSYL
ncbi:aminotransferase class I/II-fold pyridoxal phosphate-dependent enzyme [Desulfovibrio inopinatus]|uniref:aminotransferase class I/II-fold pyridoxal phosphate-dependent enzyme n=1 Tax=Desulfovibrio inopinatus TaxID=102109 RepID=UPI00042522FC|nr:pyridoxal phosphate-dependent aminotransferase family protein [Desulfovibrio inopinatus]